MSITDVSGRKAIFTFYNDQIDDKMIFLHHEIVGRMCEEIEGLDFRPYNYRKPDGEMYPDQAMDIGFKTLFLEHDYEMVMSLEIDCIPLNKESLLYAFSKAKDGIFIGNSQRSCHIDNNEHMFIPPSMFVMNRDLYEKLERPDFRPTTRGDIGEECTYQCEELGLPMEFLMPKTYEREPIGFPWDLGNGRSKYGIGTTYANENGDELFYHLFESRLACWNSYFYDKCEEVKPGILNHLTEEIIRQSNIEFKEE
jgi:hypothetical protein|tara:strand:- start:1098 stop:1856 length:759 start_codon:yes stop_codon:yes gene_type:complete